MSSSLASVRLRKSARFPPWKKILNCLWWRVGHLQLEVLTKTSWGAKIIPIVGNYIQLSSFPDQAQLCSSIRLEIIAKKEWSSKPHHQRAQCKSTKSLLFDKRTVIIDRLLWLNHLPQSNQILREKTVAYAEYNAKNQISYGWEF